MNSNPPPPEALQALLKHRPLLQHFYGAFETAAELSAQHLHRPDCFPDAHFYSHSVRYEAARLSLPLRGELGFALFILPMTGLEVLSAGDRLRFWKATDEGEIPPAGDSPGRLLFIEQEQPPLFDASAFAIHDPAKLVVLWDVDSSLSLKLFKLACPKNWENQWRSPETHWIIDIPHPATWIEGEDFGGDGLDDFGLDLDIPEHGPQS